MKILFKKYKVLIILGLVVIVAVSLLARRKPTPQPSPSLTPTPTVTPFELISIFPPEGEREIPINNLAIQFTFSVPVDASSVSVEIKPRLNLNFSISSGGKTLNVFPVEAWRYNTGYSITIDAKSKDGRSLSSPIEYSFKPKPVLDSPLTE